MGNTDNNDKLIHIIERETRLLRNSDLGTGVKFPSVDDVTHFMTAVWNTVFYESSCHYHCTGAEVTEGLFRSIQDCIICLIS